MRRLRGNRLRAEFLAGVVCVLLVVDASCHGAEATPVTVRHQDITSEVFGLRVAQRSFSFPTCPCLTVEPPTVLSVPKFDPSLGELLSTRLFIEGRVTTFAFQHARGPFAVNSSFTANVEADLVPDSDLAGLIGLDEVTVSTIFFPATFISRSGLFIQNVSSSRTRQSLYFFDETFAGDDLDLFIKTAPFDAELGFVGGAGNGHFLGASGRHSGFPSGSFLEFPTELQPGKAPGVSETEIGAGTVAAMTFFLLQLVNLEVSRTTGHNLLFSDLHLSSLAVFRMVVDYTYEPLSGSPVPDVAPLPSLTALPDLDVEESFETVPGESSAILLIVGAIAALAARRR